MQVENIDIIPLNTEITLHDVLYVPDFHFSLLSASKLAKHLSSNVVSTPNSCYIQDLLKNKQVVLGIEQGGLYFVDPDYKAPSICL